MKHWCHVFAVIQMPMIAKESLIKLIRKNSPAIREDAAEELATLFLDLQKKCENAEISSKGTGSSKAFGGNRSDGKKDLIFIQR